MVVVLKNNKRSVLRQLLASSDTLVVVSDSTIFPTLAVGEYFYLTILRSDGASEIVKVLSVSGASLTVVRAQEGTVAREFPVGSGVEMRVTAASVLEAAADAVDALTLGDLGITATAAELNILDGVTATTPTLNASVSNSTQTRDTVAALLADTTLTYTAGQIGTVTAGGYVRTRSEGFAYQVAASGASDHHVTTAGGVKLYVLTEKGVFPVGAFGSLATATAAKATLLSALTSLSTTPSFATLDLEGRTIEITSLSSGEFPILNNKEISNGRIKSTTVGAGMVSVNTLTDVTFRSVGFESTVAASGDFTAGLFNANGVALTNVKFVDCLFTCPNAAVNGIKIVNESVAVSSNISVVNCLFQNLGRMGFEVQNHNVDAVVRVSNILVSGCTFKSTGLIDIGAGTRYGMGVSLSGWLGAYRVVNNSFVSNATIDIELVGAQTGVISGNTFESSAVPISASGSRRMVSLEVTGNVCRNRASGGVNLFNVAEVMLSTNYFNLSGFVLVRDCGRVSDNSTVITAGAYAVLMETSASTTEDIDLNGVYDNSDSASNFATIRASTANVRRVRLGGVVKKPASGVLFDSISSAPAIYVMPGAVLGGTVVSGRGEKRDAGVVKAVSSSNTATATIALTVTNGSWRPATLKVFAMACDNSGGNDAHGGVFIPLNFLSSSIQIGAPVNILTLSGITSIAATSSGTTITVTVTTTATFTGQIAMDIEFVGAVLSGDVVIIS